ncbi:hypothetical protein DL767_002727 [Monosporascus sp. MG133]|nr:hypothetical protein DL767_002727 [Monosporascus sp. MG133]
MERDPGSENDALVSKAWFERFGECVPDGGAALEGCQSQAKKRVESSKRCGVIFDAAWSQTSVPYSESKDEWGSFINVLRLVTQSCEHLIPEAERSVAERVHSRLKLEGRLEGLNELGEIPIQEFNYLYSVIDNEVANDKANAEADFKACEETQLEVFRRKAVCESLAKEIEELEKAILNGEAAKKRLSMALNEKEEAEALREQTQYEADKKRDKLEGLMAGREASSNRYRMV